MEHRIDLARTVYLDMLRVRPHTPLDQLAREAHDAAEAFEAEELRRARDEQTSAATPETNEPLRVETPEATVASAETKPAIAQQSPRWGRVAGPFVVFHIWADDQTSVAECGEIEESEEPIIFCDEPPATTDNVCLDCIRLEAPAGKRWRELLGWEGDVPRDEADTNQLPGGRRHIRLDDRGYHIAPLVESGMKSTTVCGLPLYRKGQSPSILWLGVGQPLPSDHKACLECANQLERMRIGLAPEESAQGSMPPKKARVPRPKLCLVPGCGLPGAKRDGRGTWCDEHATSLDVNQRTAIVISNERIKRLTKKLQPEVSP